MKIYFNRNRDLVNQEFETIQYWHIISSKFLVNLYSLKFSENENKTMHSKL